MNGLHVREFLQTLGRKDFYKYIIVFFACFFSLLTLVIIIQRNKIFALKSRIVRINGQRKQVVSVLREHALVVQQQHAVDALLSQSKTFRISEFFDNAVRELGLTGKMNKSSVQESDLDNGYTENQLASSFKDLDMKQIVELLYKIEQSDRVYTKELMLLKSPKMSKLDVSLVIATLQPKATSTP